MRRVLAVALAVAVVAAAGACTGSSDISGSGSGGGGSADGSSARGPDPTSTSAPRQTLPDWPTYHGAADRSGATDAGPSRPLARAWTTKVDAAVYAQPLVAAGSLVVATENDTVYALDPRTGHVRWRHHLAEPARRANLPCGNIDPSGITGTPAYDATTGQVFVATEDADARHTLVALDVGDGSVRWRRSLDLLPDRDRYAEQQRGALLVAHGRVYVAFGGRAGDCGNYVGYVAAVAVDGGGAALHYAVPTAREAGMWAPPGPVLGPGGDLYVASGNGAEVDGRYDGSDSVVRLSPTLKRVSSFAPSTWRDDNRQDLDLGSMAPVPVGDRLVIAGKRGTVFLLGPSLAGTDGIGGELASLDGCAGFGGAAVRGDVLVMPCDGAMRALRVDGDRMRWLWRNDLVGGSPVIAGDSVLAFDGSALVSVDLATGREQHRVRVGEVTRFTTPVPVAPYVFVATSGGEVVAVRER